MGNDDIYHKNKSRKAKSFLRKKADRDQYKRVLIVCEGQKTEPNYFNQLRIHLGILKERVVIVGRKSGLDPMSLVEYALDEFNKEPDFDRVYCVFDRDKHTTFKAAVDKIHATKLKNKATIQAITSTPCFELWLLLHFEYTAQSFSTVGTGSNCEQLISKLKDHIPNYEKGSSNIFELTRDKLGSAKINAKLAEKQHTSSSAATNVYELVEYLESQQR